MEAESFVEPVGNDRRAGIESWNRRPSQYRQFLHDEGIPVYEGIGVRDVRDLSLGQWGRLGGRGAYLYLDSLDGIKGLFVHELGSGQASEPEQHLYHEFVLVVEGHGTAEVWLDGDSPRTFEWQPGSLFNFPPNRRHRLINGGLDRSLFIVANNAPPMFNLFRSRDFIFDNPAGMWDYAGRDPDFYEYRGDLVQVPFSKRAAIRSDFFPDIVGCELPLDNQRAPGYRRIQPAWRGLEDEHTGFVSEYPSGIYSRAHYHTSGAVLVCLKGEGYTYNWPREYGVRPWESGHGDDVRVQEYVAGGLVVAAPGGGEWFHQHFGVGRERLRVINFYGGPMAVPDTDHLNPATGKNVNLTLAEGGHSIAYYEEDPFVREMYEQELSKVGLKSQMPPELYQKDDQQV